jgi:AraC-like DNA-binding protein
VKQVKNGQPHIHDVACVPRVASSILLNRTDLVVDGSASALNIFVLNGACTVQRLIAGRWIGHQVFYRSGILMTQISEPIRIEWVGAPDGVALLIPDDMANHEFGHLSTRFRDGSYVRFGRDPVIDSLTKVLATAPHTAGEGMDEYVVGAMALRLSMLTSEHGLDAKVRLLPLPLWRLRRVVQFVNEKLDGEVALADMAAAAGLSPMHFAAQFRLAMGMRPRHYLLAQRIERAKQLLQKTDRILDVAVAVGFRTQAHFATVFRRHENVTPRQWQQECGRGLAA